VTILGRAFIDFLTFLGEVGALLWETLRLIGRGRLRLRLICQQIVNIGFGSQAVVIVTGAFTGAVFTAQTYYQATRLGMESGVGGLVSIAMCRELAPVLVGLMVTGRVGAAMAAEIGTMKVTEQVDALRAMGVSPTGYLVVPRFVAIMISMPLLIAEAILFGIIASWAIGVPMYGISEAWFMEHIDNYTELEDIAFGMIKGFIFGIIICLVACHQGLNAQNGAVGVGRCTTRAVVIASLALLICNFFLTIVLTKVFPFGEG
jgi:phospholipid/cholesterol/gamma-HCH transport system permease protein